MIACSNGFGFDGSRSQASTSSRHCFNTSCGNELSNCSCWNVNSAFSAPASLIFRRSVAPGVENISYASILHVIDDRITKIDCFPPIVVIEMAIQGITSIARSHFFGAAGDRIYLCPTMLWCFAVGTPNILAVFK